MLLLNHRTYWKPSEALPQMAVLGMTFASNSRYPSVMWGTTMQNCLGLYGKT
jgi:hypothetical protein